MFRGLPDLPDLVSKDEGRGIDGTLSFSRRFYRFAI